MLKPLRNLPVINAANLLLVENEEYLQTKLAEVIVESEEDVNVTVRLARQLPLSVETHHSRPRIDLVVFIVNLMLDRSLPSAEQSLKSLDPAFFLGKVCLVVTGARCLSVSSDRLLKARNLAASLHCPLLFAEDQTKAGVATLASRLLGLLKMSTGMVPLTTGLSLSRLTHHAPPNDPDQQNLNMDTAAEVAYPAL